MTKFRQTWRITAFLMLVSVYLFCCIIVRCLFRNIETRRHYYAWIISMACKFCLMMCNVHLKVVNRPDPKKKYLHVMNHLGMIDILCLASVRPSLFITSHEMRTTFGIGLLAEMGGCLFVERRSRSNIPNEIIEIREALKQGFNVVLYPEATSTNGEKVWPFKKTLMTSAAGTGIAIMPCVFNFRKVNGEPMSHKWRDHVCWYGDQTFLPAFLRVVSTKRVDAEIEFLDPIHVHSEEERREVAVKVQAQVEEKYVKIPLPASAGIQDASNSSSPPLS